MYFRFNSGLFEKPIWQTQSGGQNLGKLNFKKQYRSIERTKAVAFL